MDEGECGDGLRPGDRAPSERVNVPDKSWGTWTGSGDPGVVIGQGSAASGPSPAVAVWLRSAGGSWKKPCNKAANAGGAGGCGGVREASKECVAPGPRPDRRNGSNRLKVPMPQGHCTGARGTARRAADKRTHHVGQHRGFGISRPGLQR